MKFHLLPVGSRFRLDGKLYVKSSPLLATCLDSQQDKLIRRSAVVDPEQAGLNPETTQNTRPQEAALASYQRNCLSCLEQVKEHLPKSTAAALEQRLNNAWSELQQHIEKLSP